MDTDTATITRIDYDREECARCSGTGRMPFAAYGGTCFKCHGNGTSLTRKGRVAFDRVQAVRDDLLTVPVADVKVGDVVRELGTVTGLRVGLGREESMRVNGSYQLGTDGSVTVVGTRKAVTFPIGGSWVPTVRLGWTQEALQVAAAAVAGLSGATVVRDEA